MASEIIRETHELSLRTLRFKAFAITEKDIHIGATETVDALLASPTVHTLERPG